jgi:SPP1 gp7 family putative phage head morphogenesis protein
VTTTGVRRPGYIRGTIEAQKEFLRILADLHKAGLDKLARKLKSIPKSSMARALAAVEQTGTEWIEELVDSAMPSIKTVYTDGLKAGFTESGLAFDPLAADPHVLELLARSPDGIVPALRDFTETETRFAEKIIRGSFEEGTYFDLGKVIDQLRDRMPAAQYKLERIVRTETRKLAGMGKLAAWEKDPERDWFSYHYVATYDERTRQQHMHFMTGGPYEFDQVKVIWEEEREPYNCRCSLARTLKPHDVLVTEGHVTAEEAERLF